MTSIIYDQLPSDISNYPQRFVRDLASGVYNQLWLNKFYITYMPGFEVSFSAEHTDGELETYLSTVWNNDPPLEMLFDLDYFVEQRIMGGDVGMYALTKDALHYGKAIQIAPIFISYRRRESSAFALLLVDRMEKRRVTPYLDKHPDPDLKTNRLALGVQWEQELQDAISRAEFFVLLLGPSTLSKDSFVLQEITWALSGSPPKTIVPVWHNGFDPKNPNHMPVSTPSNIQDLINKINGAQVIPEDPSGYNHAIEDLLNQLNIKP